MGPSSPGFELFKKVLMCALILVGIVNLFLTTPPAIPEKGYKMYGPALGICCILIGTGFFVNRYLQKKKKP
jgi:hypothetical protein